MALVNAHTNLDRAPQAGRFLPDALGLTPVKPIERALQAMALVTVFVPESHARRVASAMAGAGAGRSASTTAPPSHRRRASARSCRESGRLPFVGEPGERDGTPRFESRWSLLGQGARGGRRGTGAHPYEEPLITVATLQIARSAARMGMLSRRRERLTLGVLAAVAGARSASRPASGVTAERLSTVSRRRPGLRARSSATFLRAEPTSWWQARCAIMTPWTRRSPGSASWSLATTCPNGRSWGCWRDAVRGLPGLDPDNVHVLPATPGWWTP